MNRMSLMTLTTVLCAVEEFVKGIAGGQRVKLGSNNYFKALGNEREVGKGQQLMCMEGFVGLGDDSSF